MISYGRITRAIEFYAQKGYQYIDAPWLVGRHAYELTAPPGVGALSVQCKPPAKAWPSRYFGATFLPASGEQSFMQMMQEDTLKPGTYQCVTPCWRDEEHYDGLSQPYFLKLELIDYAHEERPYERLLLMRDFAAEFFRRELSYAHVHALQDNTPWRERWVEPRPLDGPGYIDLDLVSETERIELGSYGRRRHRYWMGDHFWVFGTGLAEPRFTEALR